MPSPTIGTDEAAVFRFLRNGRVAAILKGEHVARVIDLGTLPDGTPYSVMEHLDGGDLAAWIKERGPLPIEQAVEFVRQACVAVAEAHSHGMVHRFLNPANLFCVRGAKDELVVKVLDFGIYVRRSLRRTVRPPAGAQTRAGHDWATHCSPVEPVAGES